MNTQDRKPLPGTQLDYFDTQAAVDRIAPGAYAKLPYTSRVHAENLVRRCDPATLTDSLKQLIERKRAFGLRGDHGASGSSEVEQRLLRRRFKQEGAPEKRFAIRPAHVDEGVFDRNVTITRSRSPKICA